MTVSAPLLFPAALLDSLEVYETDASMHDFASPDTDVSHIVFPQRRIVPHSLSGGIGIDLAPDRQDDAPLAAYVGGGMKQAVWLVMIAAAVIMLLALASDQFFTGALMRLLLLKN